MRSIIVLGVFCVAASACNGDRFSPLGTEEEIRIGQALGRSIERDTDAPMQTDSLVYHLTADGILRSTTIPFRYRNDTGKTISIVNCNGLLNVGLEKRTDAGWTLFYGPALPECLSAPITIAPGEVYEAVAPIHGALPGFNWGPEFASADLDGEYRLVWDYLVHDYTTDGPEFGRPVGPLHSNPFLLVSPS